MTQLLQATPRRRQLIRLFGRVALSPGGDIQLWFTSQVVTPLKNGTLIKNQGTIQPGPGVTVLTDDPSTTAVDDPTQVTVVSKPDLSTTTKTVAGAQPTMTTSAIAKRAPIHGHIPDSRLMIQQDFDIGHASLSTYEPGSTTGPQVT